MGRSLFGRVLFGGAIIIRVPLKIIPCTPIASSSFIARYDFRQPASHMFRRIAACNLCNMLSDLVTLAISSKVIALGTACRVTKFTYSSASFSCCFSPL